MKKNSKTAKSQSAKKQLVKTASGHVETKNVPREIQRVAVGLCRLARERAKDSWAAMAAVSGAGFCVGIDLRDRQGLKEPAGAERDEVIHPLPSLGDCDIPTGRET